MTARRVVISGRVQGVGYRDWMRDEAARLGLSGWVRNCSDGTVEALVDGEEATVQELLRACQTGPKLASVRDVFEELSDPHDRIGFIRLPTA